MDIIIMDYVLKTISLVWLPMLAPVLCFGTILSRRQHPAIYYWPWFPLMEFAIAAVFALIIWSRYLHVRQTLYVKQRTGVAETLNRVSMQLGLVAIVCFIIRTTLSIMPSGTKENPSTSKKLGVYFRLLLPIFPTIYCGLQVRLTDMTRFYLGQNRLLRLARTVIASVLILDVILLTLWEFLKASLGVRSDGLPNFSVYPFMLMQPYYPFMYWLMALLIAFFVSTFSYEFYGARIARRPNQEIEKNSTE